MIHLSEQTWRFRDTGMTFPFPTINILMYLSGQNETLPWDLSMPTTPLTYDCDPTCCTFSSTTGATTNYTYDSGNSSINTGKTCSLYTYDDICDLHPGESRSTNNATYVDSNLYYYGYRYYNPEFGRWVSRDPIGEEGGLNVYVVLGNGLTDKTDPLGRKTNNPGIVCKTEQYVYCSVLRKRWEVENYDSPECCVAFLLGQTFNIATSYKIGAVGLGGTVAFIIVHGGPMPAAIAAVGGFVVLPAVHLAAKEYCNSNYCFTWATGTRVTCSYDPRQFD